MRIVAVYKSPHTILQTYDIKALLNTPKSVIIIGYLNFKHFSWNSQKNNQAGIALLKYVDSRNDVIVTAPSTPTRYSTDPRHSSDVLDIAILKTGRLGYHMENFPLELSSDHSPILLDIHERAAQTYPPKPLITMNWMKFENEMEKLPMNLPELTN